MKKYNRLEIEQAYRQAKKECPSNEARNICLQRFDCAYWYAYNIDQKARKDIKNALKSKYNEWYQNYIVGVEQ